MNIFKLSLKNIFNKPLSSTISLALLILGIGIISLLLQLNTLIKDQMDNNLKGIDMCPEELALANTSLTNSGVDLIESRAQNLIAISDNSIDIVLCHWALTLMDPIVPVLDEVRRVLTPKGRFVALVDGPMSAAPGYKEVHDLIYSYAQKEIPSYGKIDLGDPRQFEKLKTIIFNLSLVKGV